jgi:hypothetical protein
VAGHLTHGLHEFAAMFLRQLGHLLREADAQPAVEALCRHPKAPAPCRKLRLQGSQQPIAHRGFLRPQPFLERRAEHAGRMPHHEPHGQARVVQRALGSEDLLPQPIPLGVGRLASLECHRQVVGALAEQRVDLVPQDAHPVHACLGPERGQEFCLDRRATFLEARPDRIWKDPHPAASIPPELLPHESQHLGALPLGEDVHLREQESDVGRVTAEGADQFQVVL